jgi:hypothetical protein
LGSSAAEAWQTEARRVPEWELFGIHPAVFVKVASKGVTGYVTWKSGRTVENTRGKIVGVSGRPEVTSGMQRTHLSVGTARKSGRGAHPLFFVSVASKGVRFSVSLLFATLARRSISVAAKGLTGADCWRKSNGLGWEDLGGV